MIAIFSVLLQPINRDRTSLGRVTAGVVLYLRPPKKPLSIFSTADAHHFVSQFTRQTPVYRAALLPTDQERIGL